MSIKFGYYDLTINDETFKIWTFKHQGVDWFSCDDINAITDFSSYYEDKEQSEDLIYVKINTPFGDKYYKFMNEIALYQTIESCSVSCLRKELTKFLREVIYPDTHNSLEEYDNYLNRESNIIDIDGNYLKKNGGEL